MQYSNTLTQQRRRVTEGITRKGWDEQKLRRMLNDLLAICGGRQGPRKARIAIQLLVFNLLKTRCTISGKKWTCGVRRTSSWTTKY